MTAESEPRGTKESGVAEEPLRPSWALHDDSLLPLFEGAAEFYVDVLVKAFRRLKAALKIDDGLAVQAASVVVAAVGRERIVEVANQKSKRARTSAQRPSPPPSQSAADDEPATEKQIAYLKKLGVQVPPNLTKRQASELIDEMLGKTD